MLNLVFVFRGSNPHLSLLQVSEVGLDPCEEHSYYYFVIGLNPHCGLIMSLLLLLLLD